MAIKKIPFKQADVKKFLDSEIKFWRKQRLLHVSKRKDNLRIWYVEGIILGLQSVRKNLFGAELK